MSPEVGSTSVLVRSRAISVRSLDSSGSDSHSLRKIFGLHLDFIHSVTVSALGALPLPVQPVLRILRAGGGAQIVPVRQGPSLTRSICARHSDSESWVRATDVEFSDRYSEVC